MVSRVKRVPREIENELMNIKTDLDLASDSEAFKKMAKFSTLGRETLIKKHEYKKLRFFK